MPGVSRDQLDQQAGAPGVVAVALGDREHACATTQVAVVRPAGLVRLVLDLLVEPLDDVAVVTNEVDVAVGCKLVERPDDPGRAAVDATLRMIAPRLAVVRVQRPEPRPRVEPLLRRQDDGRDRRARPPLVPRRLAELLVARRREEHAPIYRARSHSRRSARAFRTANPSQSLLK